MSLAFVCYGSKAVIVLPNKIPVATVAESKHLVIFFIIISPRKNDNNCY